MEANTGREEAELTESVRPVKRHEDWSKETTGNLLVVATVIAAITFQVMVTPPGGVWQNDDCSNAINASADGNITSIIKHGGYYNITILVNSTTTIEHYKIIPVGLQLNVAVGEFVQVGEPLTACQQAGAAVYERKKPVIYTGLVISCAFSFSASMTFIFLFISGFRLRNPIVVVFLRVFMWAAVLCVTTAFLFVVALIQSDNNGILNILLWYMGFWILLALAITLYQIGRSIVWLICCCYRPSRQQRRQNAQRLPPLFPSPAP